MTVSRPLPCLLLLAAGLTLAAGCGSSSDRVTLEGSVKYDGQAVDQGGLTFIPEGGDGQVPRATCEIEDGRYRFNTRNGPKPGKYRVQIYWQKKTGKKVKGE